MRGGAVCVRYDRGVSLVRSHRQDDLDRLRSKAADLDVALSARAADVARVRSMLEAFRIRYLQEVGRLHEELDDLQKAISEAELAESEKREREPVDPDAPPRPPRPEPLPRFTTDAVRKLFRDVAKAIHPDLAQDDVTRDRRHALMVEANRAYALGDEARLRWVLEAWERSPEAVSGSDADAIRERLVRRIAQLEAQLEIHAADLAGMQDTPLWQLKTMVDEAAGRGKDLMADMVRRLKRDLMAARNRLDAIQFTP